MRHCQGDPFSLWHSPVRRLRMMETQSAALKTGERSCLLTLLSSEISVQSAVTSLDRHEGSRHILKSSLHDWMPVINSKLHSPLNSSSLTPMAQPALSAHHYSAHYMCIKNLGTRIVLPRGVWPYSDWVAGVWCRYNYFTAPDWTRAWIMSVSEYQTCFWSRNSSDNSQSAQSKPTLNTTSLVYFSFKKCLCLTFDIAQFEPMIILLTVQEVSVFLVNF